MLKNSVHRSSKPVAIWIFTGVAMIIIQVLLGGITRLTGSGLSITEWDVVTGIVPPLNNHQWINEFEKYKQTAQFKFLNFNFTLSDFKFIFFWEWLHRLWGRLIGVVFVIPFVIFLLQRRFKPEMIKPLIILFLLGALQGAVGWIMVISGLTGDAVYVNPSKLALHFILALGLLCYTFWFGLQLLIPKQKIMISPSLNRILLIIIVLITIQLTYGALMAGYKAAIAAPTWPDINNNFFPPNMFSGGLLSLIDNKITIHFIHRNLGYIILILIFAWSIKARHSVGVSIFNTWKFMPAILVSIQVLLGVFSVLTSVRIVPGNWGIFEWVVELHQLTAIFLLLSVVLMLYMVRSKNFILLERALNKY